MSKERGERKVLRGKVLSDKMEKTIIVCVERRFPHPVYKKVVRNTRNLKVHDESNSAHIGDEVEIMETRPLSKDKRWRLVKVVGRKYIAENSTTDQEAEIV